MILDFGPGFWLPNMYENLTWLQDCCPILPMTREKEGNGPDCWKSQRRGDYTIKQDGQLVTF
jgi:hypothetical protein